MGISLKKVAKKAKHYDYVLLLMRHAKTEPTNSSGDYERELTDKGLKQAKKVAKGLSELDMVPDRIACSSAVRAAQTLERMLKIFGDKPKVDYRQSLYADGLQGIFDEFEQTKDKQHTLLIVGHEPTVSMASQWIVADDCDADMLGSLNLGLAPATVVVFGSDKPISGWDMHSADLIAVLSAKNFDS
jgi:phosphohistidine phosphatase